MRIRKSGIINYGLALSLSKIKNIFPIDTVINSSVPFYT